MANALYAKGKEGLLDGTYDWSASTIKAVLVTSGYTVNLATDEFLSDIPGGAIVATSPAFTSKTQTGGVANAANATFSAVTGPTAAYIVIYEDTGSSATSRLLAYMHTATGLPVTPNGGSITITWDNGAN